MSSASKVGELFKAAGQAFCELGDLSAQLQLAIDRNSHSMKAKKGNESYDRSELEGGQTLTETSQRIVAQNEVRQSLHPSSGVGLSASNTGEHGDSFVDIESLSGQQPAASMKVDYDQDEDLSLSISMY